MTMGRFASALLVLFFGVACGSTTDETTDFPGTGATGGAAGAGGASTGGTAGTATGGGGSGGTSTGGTGTGATGGGGTGGTGGTSTGGTAGSTSTGGTGTGATGGGGTGGSGGTHLVGGTVQGLLGTGLKLKNNGGDELAVSKDGPFSFATALAAGQPYAVTVSAQPASPAQTCIVDKASGTMGSADVTDVAVQCNLVDTDGDKVPDVADPFPNDATKPKLALANVVYPHTASTLFTMDVVTHAIAQVGTFKGSGYSGSMTDLAVDQWGVLYGVTFDSLYTCDANTATCYKLATLPQSFNGLTMLPPGTHHPYLDTLVAIANSGAWYKVAIGSGTAQLTSMGSYGGGYTSSGDAFSIEGVGTYGSVDKPGVGNDVIVEVDPMTGAVKKEVTTLSGYSSLYGLAGWQGVVFGFDATGAVLEINTTTGATKLIATTSNAWWGAGVATRLK